MVVLIRFYGISLLIASLLTGCAISEQHIPEEPDRTIDLSKIPNAVPRHEPRSRYGNPQSYVVFGRRYHTLSSPIGFVETGIASWYGPNFHGKRTSSQEVYDMYKMTAAHKSLPIPSYVEVTNLKNGRHVIVRVNDRGPFHENRVIDLSYAAAAKLGIVNDGTGMVEIRAIDPSDPFAHHQTEQVRLKPVPQQVKHRQQPQVVNEKKLYVQLGAFSDLENARKFRHKIQQSVKRSVSIATIEKQGKPLYKVRIGPLNDVKAADHVVHDLNMTGFYDHHVVFQ